MEELFKNDKMYTMWDPNQNTWMFSRVGDKPTFFGESGADMLRARPHLLQADAMRSLTEVPIWDAHFTEFFKEKNEVSRIKRGFYAFGRSFLPPRTNGHVALAIGIAVLAYLLVNTPSSLPSSNSTSVTAVNQALVDARMNISAASLALALAGTVILLFLGTYTSYNEKPENIKWYQKEIEEEIKNKEAIISSMISFLSSKFEITIEEEAVLSDLITEMEETKSPQRYKKIQQNLKYLSDPTNYVVLKIAQAISLANLPAASMDDFLFQQNAVIRAPQGEPYLKRKGIAFALELLESDVTLLIHLQKIFLLREEENIGKLYIHIKKLVKSDPRVLGWVKEINEYLDKVGMRRNELERYTEALQNRDNTIDGLRQAIFTCRESLYTQLRAGLRSE